MKSFLGSEYTSLTNTKLFLMVIYVLHWKQATSCDNKEYTNSQFLLEILQQTNCTLFYEVTTKNCINVILAFFQVITCIFIWFRRLQGAHLIYTLQLCSIFGVSGIICRLQLCCFLHNKWYIWWKKASSFFCFYIMSFQFQDSWVYGSHSESLVLNKHIIFFDIRLLYRIQTLTRHLWIHYTDCWIVK